jgi:tyrosyl-tRNA synthetase
VKDIEKLKLGCVEVLPENELQLHLAIGSRLRIKFGIDPSTSELHLGHLVPILKLKQLQEMGHQICLVIGNFTATIGDPTGRNLARPNNLSFGQAQANGESLLNQIFLFLDRSKTEVNRNLAWYQEMKTTELLSSLRNFTLSQFLERDDFQKRFKEQKPIYLNEFLYPFFQANDSARMNVNIELGGTDQKFNMLLGREVQRINGLLPQVVMTVPIIVGTDGVHKMSKSLGNHINIKDEPLNTLGKIMSIPDSAMEQYFKYILCMSADEMNETLSKFSNPRDAKMFLAMNIVTLLHNKSAAMTAHDEFNRRFREKAFPDEVRRVEIDGKHITQLPELLIAIQAASSKRAAKQLIESNSVHFYDKPENCREDFISKGTYRFRVGKQKFYSVEVF